MTALLDVAGLHAYYGRAHILQGLDLTVGAGEIVSLLGRNGTGRSTVLKAIMGQLDTTGSIHFNEQQIRGSTPFEIARRGVGYVPETRDVFAELSVAQNLLLGQKAGMPSRWSADDMYRLFPQLAQRRSVPAGALSGGEQQMLALCRTLMGDPQLILVDEPTEGLAPQVVELVAGFLQALRQRGVAVLLVEQKLAIALAISQRVYVMGHGRTVFAGTPAQLAANQSIRREWLEI